MNYNASPCESDVLLSCHALIIVFNLVINKYYFSISFRLCIHSEEVGFAPSGDT